jgi:hypothetical protein
MNALELALARWLAHPPTIHEGPVCPPVAWTVGPDARIAFGSYADPFDGMTIASWSKDDR